MMVKRTIGLSLLFLLMAGVAVAERELTLGEFAAEVRGRVVGKVREALSAGGSEAEVSGVVTCVGGGFFFLQKGEDGLKVLAKGAMPAAGDEVLVTGAPSLEGGRVVFAADGWKRSGSQPIPVARPVTADDLVDAGEKGVNGLRVTFEGRAIGKTENGFAVNVGNVPVNVMLTGDLPDFIDDCDRTHPNVRVTGVAELMPDQASLLGRDGYVMGVKVDVSAASDVELLTDLAYLAAKRDRAFMRIVTGVLIALAIGLMAFAAVVFRQRRGMFKTRTIMAERKRMADDIHDTIEQHLVGAGMLLKVNRLKEAQDVLVRAKAELRDIVWGLKNDDMMRQTPAEMIRQLAHVENVKGLYRVDTSLKGLPEHLDAGAMRDLSLIVRETIGNAVKHGGAKHIAISSDALENGGWRMRISNDGTPFDPETAPGAKEGHFGIEGMKQRGRRIGATVTIERRGKGMVLGIECRAV